MAYGDMVVGKNYVVYEDMAVYGDVALCED